jgi:hypothetical protein
MPRGFGVIGTGELIREYLSKVDMGSVMQMFRYVKARCKAEGYRPGTWRYFPDYVRRLERLGLIVEARRERIRKFRGQLQGATPPQPSHRVYYRLVRERRDDLAWLNPQKALYGRKRKKKGKAK